MGIKENEPNINNYKWQICYQKPLYDAEKIKNFAIWNSDINYLNEVKNPVDLLIIQYHFFYRNISNDGLYDGISDDSSPVDSVTFDIDNYSGRTPTTAFTKDRFTGKNGSNEALIPKLDTQKYNQSNLERLDSPYFTNSPFSTFTPNSTFNNNNNNNINNTFANSTTGYNNISLCVDTETLYGSKRILVDIDISEFIRSYSGKITTLTIGKYITKRIRKVMEMSSINWIWGFYFSNLQNLIDKYGIEDCQQFLFYFRKSFPYYAIFTDIKRLDVFEEIRDLIHGIVLYNVVFHPDGKQKSRWEWENMKFQDYIAALRNEISLRADFAVLDVEVLSPEMDQTFHHYQRRRYYRKWIMGNNFKGWISFDPEFKSLKCIGPPEFPLVNDFDLYEMCMSSEVSSCRDLIQELLPELDWKDKPLNRSIWQKVLREADLPREIINRLPSLTSVTQIELSDALIYCPSPPALPPMD